MKKYYLLLFFFIISIIHIQAQLSNVHYLPPLKQGGNNQAIRQQAFYLSTPETTAFDVSVFRGTNTTAIATLNISNTAPEQYNIADGDNNITLVTNTNTGIVLNNSGLRFESENGEEFYVNYRGRSSSQATSLTSKGRQAIGTLFKWGGRPNYGNGQNSLNATLGIMATDPGTTTINIFGYGTDCEFRLQGDDDGITDDTLTITLTQGQTYVLEAWRNATAANIDCWLGATIQSDKKIAISNGNLNGAPRIGANSRDAVIDQPVPENVLGREYIFIRGNGVNDIETPIIIGTQNGTDIFVGGVLQTTINNGEYYVINGSNYSPQSAGGNMYVTTSKEVYAYQHLSGSGSIFTGGLNFIAPVNCLLPDRLSNISNIRDVDGSNFNGGITIVAATTTPNANIIVTDGTGTIALANEQTVNGTGDWKTFYIPGLTGNVSVQSTGPIAVGFLGVSGAAGIAGYFSGFDTVPVVELDVTGGGCLPGADVFEISSSFDAYQWFQNGVLIGGATTNSFTPTEPGNFFVRVTKGTCTYDSAILSVYNCDPEIVLTKTVDTSPVIEGDTVTFTITVEHLGVNPVSNLVINDALPSELTFGTGTPSFGTWTAPDWTIGTMFSGEIHTLILEATVNEGSAGLTVTNTISNTQTEVEANALPDDPTEDVTIINNELEITKSDQAPPDGSYDSVGEVITYDFVVTNTGNQVIPSVTISDPNIDSGSLSPASVSNLGIGAVANFTATHTITQSDIEADQVVNTATAEGTLSNGFVISDTSDDPTTIASEDPTITPIEQLGALVLEKIAQPALDGLYDALGEVITYEFTVINTGNVSLDNVTITDPNIDPGSLSPISVANLPAGASAVFTATHTIVQLDFDNGSTTNSATASGTEPVEGLVVSDTSDDPTTLAPNDATVVTIPQFGQLEVTKVDDAPTNGPYNTLGQTITYTIIATSVGNVTLTDINVVDPNADTITLISTTGTDTGTDDIVDSMAPMDTATFEATHVITQDDLDAAQAVNTATVGAQDPGLGSVTDLSDDPDDPTTTTNDPTIVPLISTPSISVTKLADDDSNVTEGQIITYTYTVSNLGNVTFDEVSLTDIHSGSGSLGTITLQSTTGTDDGVDNDVDQLDPGTIATWTATYITTASDITNQTDITNTVTVTTTPRTGSIADPTDLIATETVTVNPIETICGGTTLAHDLTADVDPTIVSFSWSATNNPFVAGETTVTSTDSNITDTLVNTSITDQEVIYTITGFDSLGAVLDTYTYTVTIQRTPRVNNTTRTVDICTGDTLNQNLITHVTNYTNGVTFSWSAVDNPNVSGETTSTSTDDRIQDTLTNTSSTDQDIIYTITPTADANGCVGTMYTITVTIEPPLVLPPNDSAIVQCIADATQPTAPVVTDSSGSSIIPVITENADPTCEGDKIYTYTYTDCAGNVSIYTFTYTIDVTTSPVVPVNGTATVECIADATQPTAPTVTDVCNNDITPVITENTDPTCEGDKIYTYTYTDCAGNVSIYTFTYTIDVTTSPVVPVNGTATVECIADATQPIAPTVTDVCNNDITPVITENADPACEGDKIYTYTYTDCAGNVSIYTFTYTLDVTTSPVVPVDGTATVECIADATQPTTPTVTDVCNNDITPVITENTDPTCEGDKIYTYTYTDCAGNVSIYTFTYTIDVTTSPVVPVDGTATVECIADATQPTAPTVTDVCNNDITPVITENSDPACEGDKIYTYTYTDCAGNVSIYTFTYTLDITTSPVVPANGTATVECIADATQPIAPTVTDVCNNDITPVITENTDPTCEGDKIYTYTYTDCAGNISIYTFTYTLDVTTSPVVPVNGTATVECIADATQPTAPTVTDVCNNDITPVITENTDPACEGDNIYTYTYTDCAGNVSIYTFTYTLDVTTSPVVPVDGTAIVNDIIDAIQPTAPIVTDVCGNNIIPVITESTNPTCDGIKTYTFTYTDCAGNNSTYNFTYTIDVTATLEISDVSTSICSNTSLEYNLSNLTSLSGVTFDWVVTPNPNVSGAINGNGTIIPDTIQNISGNNEDVIYTITPFNSNGCNGNTFTLTITIQPEPLNTAAPTDDTCSNTSLNHNLSSDVNIAGTSFSWVAADNTNVSGETTTPDTSSLITDTLINISGSIQTVIYTVTPTSPDGCVGMPYTYTVTVSPEAEMIVTKSFLPSADGSYDAVGEVIQYEIVIQNVNDVEINNVNITDTNADVGSISPATIPTIPAMGSATITALHTITQDDLNTGQVINSATVVAVDPCGNIVSDISDDPTTGTPNDNTITPLDQNPSISLEKTATFNDENGDGFPQQGETLTYNFSVTNTGNVTLTDITISDPLVTVNGGPISLDPGASDTTTFVATFIITQGNIDSGSVTNSATVNTEAPDGSTITDTSDDPNNPDNNDSNGDGDPDDATIITLQSNPELTINKTGVFIDSNGDGLAQVGETIQYSFDVSNTGNVTVFGITIIDPLVTISGGSINLPPNQTDSNTFTAIYTITQDDINTGSVTNSAIGSGTDPNGNPVEDVSDDPTTADDNDDTITSLSRDPQLTLLKTAVFNDENADGFPQEGETINYIFDVRNTGNVTISSITITDPLVSITGGPIDLDPNESDTSTFTATYTITLSDLNTGSITNSATVTGQDPDGTPITDISDDPNNPDNNDIDGDGDPDDTTVTPLLSNPRVSITKTGIFEDENGDGLAQVGETISYAFDISNIGNVTITNINVTDALVTVTGAAINLNPGQNDTTTFTASYSINQNDIDAGLVQNTAITNGQDPNGNPVSDTSDDPNNPTDNDTNGDGEPDDVTNTVLPFQGNLSLIKTALVAPDGSYDSVGEQIIYELSITNTGNVTLTNVVVSDANADAGSITPSVITSISPGQTIIANATHTITQNEIDAGVVSNSASVEGVDPFGNPITDISDDPNNATDNDANGDGDPDDITDTNIAQNPSIELEKTATFNDENGNGIPQQGETITYNFNVTNTGNVTLSNITISDPLATVNGGPITLAPSNNDTTTFFATYTITQANIDSGSITNSATVNAEDTNGNPISDTSDDPNDPTDNDTNGDGEPDDVTITTLPSNPELTIFKTGVFIDTNNDGLAQAGETIQYNFDVSNTGNVTISNITVSDPLIPVTGGPITLIPGQTDNTTFTAFYVLLQSDVNAGEVINTATSSGIDPSGGTVTDDSDDPTTTDNNDATITTLARDPQLTLFKTANFNDENGDGIPQNGETISYTFDVRNTGNVTITNITISDPIVSVTGGPINLNPAETDNTSFTATYIILQSDIDSGNISNSALVTGEDDDGGIITDVSDFSDDPDNPNNEDLDGDGDPDDPTVTDLIGNPELTLLKTGTFNDTNGDGFAQIGETITYAFEVINSGNTTITDITISDPLVAVNGGLIDLIPGQNNTTTFTATYTITQFDVDTGSITNAAVVSGQDPNGTNITDNSDDPNNPTDIDDNNDGNPDDDTVTTFMVQGGISIIKESLSADDGAYDTVGEQIKYSLTITNTGNTTLTNIVITDNNADAGSISPSNITILLPGETISVTAAHTITQLDLDTGIVSNTATVEGTDPFGNILDDISDDPNDPTNNDSNGDGDPDDITNTDMIQNPSIGLTKAADDAPDGLWDTVGEIITYTLQVTNTGNVTLSNITISDSNADAGSIVPSNIATLLPGETITVIAAHTITQQDLDTGSVTNTASVTAEDTNGGIVTDDSDDPNNPTDDDTNGDGEPDDVTVTSTPQLATVSILKTVDTTTYTEVGDILNYAITVTNTGNVTLLNINVTDPNAVLTSPSSIASLAPGETFSVTAEHVITEDDMIDGFVSNTAFVSASIPNSTKVIIEDSDDPDDPTDSDSDNDGDPDDPTVSYLDTDGDGIPNIIDLDDDNDGITDVEEQNGDPLLDTDGDGIIDSLDLDADGDGIYDYIEGGHDGIDSDGDGTIDGPYGDDGIPDSVQDDPDNGEVNYDPQDSDGDGIDDFQDIDDDNDGILTEDENPDPDGDMIPDDAIDSDGDGIPDYLEPNNADPTSEDDLEIFNAVTPNGDGDNDVFIIRNIENFPNNELKIFNRWGVLVYEAIGYGQSQEYFRGESNGRATVNQERQLPVGTYFYVLVYKNNAGISKTRSGYLYINR
ncbi:PKD-like domain-containing protein [uncultured Aquimarina sp.]|uniref:DUF7507 domain-containing protein n=1 Tax=uncultured Aquimarina sp. TaxID=575652 RepID=UPI0026240271|nr:PKD-like domain-containing protein [uncultured Aquimarina sp.]